jgi:hypothetical protein
LPIIEHLNELKNLSLHHLAGMVIPLMDEIVLQGTEETFDHRIVIIVITVAPPTPTRRIPVLD